ncbi:alpha/beta fold hydrolase [Bryobacter aggregatus]|uniref:alpha/beta fold hydrolase n=1 Tax=Bryobacter aggregatus TaxID=360054 RepID=UPI0009B599AD|nr:alpha/beta hydrolase [Bryobacter aggregatus]
MVTRLMRNYERNGLADDASLYPAPGALIDIGGRSLHIQKQGAGPATVVLEAGIAASSLSWRLVDAEIAKFATVYSYDRAGLGWSPYNDRPKIARDLIEEMRLVLTAAQVPTPRIVVGHSFGGMLMRMYASMYPEEVAGVVLVDALTAEEWFPLDSRRTRILQRATQLSRRGIWLAERGIVRFALHSVERGSWMIPSILSKLSGAGRMNVPQKISGQIQKLPPDVRRQVRAHWSRATSFRTMSEYLANLPASCAQAQLCPDLGGTPLIVLAAEQGDDGNQGRQAKLAKLSRRGDFRVVPGAGHWILLDKPQAVIEAVHDLVIALP